MKAKIDFTYNKKFYSKDEEVNDIKDFDIIVKLNERGFIYPLTPKELYEIKEKYSKLKEEVK